MLWTFLPTLSQRGWYCLYSTSAIMSSISMLYWLFGLSRVGLKFCLKALGNQERWIKNLRSADVWYLFAGFVDLGIRIWVSTIYKRLENYGGRPIFCSISWRIIPSGYTLVVCWWIQIHLVILPDWRPLSVMGNFNEMFLRSQGSQFHTVLKTQEAVRKSVERVYGVLFCLFLLLYVACKFWNTGKMLSIATAAILLHNMVVEDEKSGYVPDGRAGRS